MLPSVEFLSFIQQNKLFEPQERVLLALSGGRDSVLMAHLFHRAGYNFALAHVNFQLRGAESDADEAFCQALAKQMNVPFYVVRFDTQSYAQKESQSIQMAARHLRYNWLESIRFENGFDYIALAHHQNDSIETVLLNMVRGTGISGLHGILPKRGHLIRPLLGFKRDEIDAWVQQAQLSYREDSSNQSVKYARNKIRLEVIPKLKELNPALEETFEANRKRMAELEVLLHLRVAELQPQLFSPIGMEQFKIAISALKTLKPLNTLLFELFRPYAFTESVLAELLAAWDGQSGKVFQSATHQILIDREFLILSPLGEIESSIIRIAEPEGRAVWNGQEFSWRVIAAADFNLDSNAAKAQLDAEKIVFPLSLRSWQLGDSFRPLGMKGQKKLSDFFIEQKIPLNRKKHIAVLQNGNADLLWLAGLRIDERYKVSASTKKVFIFEQVQNYGS